MSDFETPQTETTDTPPDPHPPARKGPAGVLVQAGAAGLAVVLGLAGASGLVAAGKAAEKTTPPEQVDLVEVLEIHPATTQAVVETTGTVVAEQQSVLAPEVGGRVTWVSDKLRPGGRFVAGEALARIDSRDYEVAVEQARVAVEQARLELALEESRGTVAEKEWALLGSAAGDGGTLARRVPHLEVSKAALASAEAGLRRADLNLARTSVRAPYNGLVLSESIDRGQVVGAQSQVAVFASSDRARIEVSVPFERLRTLDVPGIDGIDTDAGSTATVRQTMASGPDLTRQARVVGAGGQLDPQTRTATLLLSVDAPLDPVAGGLPLLIGAFVDVTLDGRTREGALTVPRSALYNGDTVWVVNAEERLEPRTVTTGWALSSSIEVNSGLQDGDRVVTTPLASPVAGTRVKLVGGETAARGN